MYKSQRSIANEVERIKEVLLPSQEKTLVLHMWRPGDPPCDTREIKLPPDNPPHNMRETEIVEMTHVDAKGLRERRRVIIVPLKEKPDPSELKQYLESMAREEGAKQE